MKETAKRVEKIAQTIFPNLLSELEQEFSQNEVNAFKRMLNGNIEKNDLQTFSLNLKLVKRYFGVLRGLFETFGEKNLFFYEKKDKEQQLLLQNIETLIFHKECYKEKLNSSKHNIFETKLFSVYDGNKDTDVVLNFEFSTNRLEKDSLGGFQVMIQSGDTEIFKCSFFRGKDEIFISSIQNYYGISDFLIILKFHKIAFNIIFLLGKKWKIKSVRMYKNSTHPSRYGKEHKGFTGNYDNLAMSYKLFEKNIFFIGDINFLNKKISRFIQMNIESSLSKVEL